MDNLCGDKVSKPYFPFYSYCVINSANLDVSQNPLTTSFHNVSPFKKIKGSLLSMRKVYIQIL